MDPWENLYRNFRHVIYWWTLANWASERSSISLSSMSCAASKRAMVEACAIPLNTVTNPRTHVVVTSHVIIGWSICKCLHHDYSQWKKTWRHCIRWSKVHSELYVETIFEHLQKALTSVPSEFHIMEFCGVFLRVLHPPKLTAGSTVHLAPKKRGLAFQKRIYKRC